MNTAIFLRTIRVKNPRISRGVYRRRLIRSASPVQSGWIQPLLRGSGHYLRLVEPRHRVIGPDVWKSEATRSLSSASRRVTARAPRAMLPPRWWYQMRSERTAETASSALLGFAAPPLADPLPEGLERRRDGSVAAGAVYDAWVRQEPAAEPWDGACLGGVPDWDQADTTPSCTHGEMRHLLDYKGEQFIDGALHVFACRTWACDLAFVADF